MGRPQGPLPDTVARRYPHGYAVVDVETSGLHPAAHRVLQVAVAQMAPDGHLESTWSTLLDPGCDPGPTHIHGLTRVKLAGSPQYAHVASRVASLVDQRVLVAHNAQFDWRFLSAEASRGNVPLAVEHRLCTLALTRRLDLPLPNMKLGSVAAYWGVRQHHAHDAADDTRVLVEILRHSLVVADRLGLRLPLTSCRNQAPVHAFPAPAPRPACPWKYAGNWSPDAPLVQGMKVVITGPTRIPREALTSEATTAGLDVMNMANSRTSVLVCDDHGCDTRKLASARHHAVPVISEAHFLSLLSTVAPGTPKAGPDSATSAPARSRPVATAPQPRQRGPLTGHRVLILGGPHAAAASVRERVTRAGGQPAANLTATVTGVVALQGADTDPRWGRIAVSDLPVLDPDTLTATERPLTQTEPVRGSSAPPDDLVGRPGWSAAVDDAGPPVVLPRGGVADLPAAAEWSLSVRWPDFGQGGVDVDVVAFLTDADEEVATDDDFVFFNAPTHPSGATDLTLDVPGEALVNVHPGHLPERTFQVLVAAAVVDGVTFGQVGPVELVLRDQDGVTAARATLDAATDEQTLVLATLYRRAGAWRFRAVGQGYEFGLTALAVRHGVDVDED